MCITEERFDSLTVNRYSLCRMCVFHTRIYNCFEAQRRCLLEISLLSLLFFPFFFLSLINCLDSNSALCGTTKLLLTARQTQLPNKPRGNSRKSYARIYIVSNSTLLFTKHKHLPYCFKYLLGTLHICVIRFSSIVLSTVVYFFSLDNFFFVSLFHPSVNASRLQRFKIWLEVLVLIHLDSTGRKSLRQESLQHKQESNRKYLTSFY